MLQLIDGLGPASALLMLVWVARTRAGYCCRCYGRENSVHEHCSCNGRNLVVIGIDGGLISLLNCRPR